MCFFLIEKVYNAISNFSNGDPCVFSPDPTDPGSGSLKNIYKINKIYVNSPHDLCRTYMLYKKRFYNRETNSSVFCAIKLMSFKPPLPTMELKKFTFF